MLVKSVARKILALLLPLSALLALYGAFPAGASAPGGAQLPTQNASVARDAGPEDGVLCCSGAEPLLFNGREALAITGRAGVFKSYDEGGHWMRSMQGLVAPNGVAPYVTARCQSPSNPRIVYVLAGLGTAVTPFNGIFASEDF